MNVRMHEILLFVTKAVLIQLKEVRVVIFKVISCISSKFNQAEIGTSYA
jgi:hypothetical protein